MTDVKMLKWLCACLVMTGSVVFACNGSIAVHLQGNGPASAQGKAVQVSTVNDGYMITNRQGKAVKTGVGAGKHHVKVTMPNGNEVHREVYMSCGEHVELLVGLGD